ncbi:MAG: hypothetical protein Q4B90_00640 [Eubacteriales bacterium]|nr:hypothetical protein [Eubacteriales bacterium]
MEMYQTSQMQEEIRRLREISNENQEKVNHGIFEQEKIEHLNENSGEEDTESGSGIWRGILFLIMAAILLGQASGNKAVSQVMNQIGETIQNIGEQAEEKEWFSFGSEKTEEEQKNK